MKRMCMNKDDVGVVKDIVLDYLNDISDYIESGIPTHRDWRKEVDSVLYQYGTAYLGLKELERRMEVGDLQVCWYEGVYGG